MPISWLVDIPLEVREMVYTEVFTRLRVRPFELLQDKPQNDQERHAGFSLFLVNKRVYAECKAIFLKQTIFDLRGHQDLTNSWRIITITVDAPDLVDKLVRSKNLDIRRIQRVVCSNRSTLAAIATLKAKLDAATPGSPSMPLQEIAIDRTGYAHISENEWSAHPAWTMSPMITQMRESALSCMLPLMPLTLESATIRYTVRSSPGLPGPVSQAVLLMLKLLLTRVVVRRIGVESWLENRHLEGQGLAIWRSIST